MYVPRGKKFRRQFSRYYLYYCVLSDQNCNICRQIGGKISGFCPFCGVFPPDFEPEGRIIGAACNT